MIDIILFKYPGIQGITYWSVDQNGNSWKKPIDGLIWDNKKHPKPKQSDIKKWGVEYNKELARYDRENSYRDKREYASFGDQLDMIYWDKKNGTNNWINHIDNIKKLHPKPKNKR